MGVAGKDRLMAAVEEALAAAKDAGATQAEATVAGGETYLTRFATNHIHQNVGETDTGLAMRVILGKRIGRASTNTLDRASIKECAEKAAAIARLSPENPDFKSLPEPEPIPVVDGWAKATAACSPEERAKGVGAIVAAAKAKGYEASGAFQTGTQEVAIGNSLGVCGYFASTSSSLSTVVMSGTSAGYGSADARDVREIDPAAVGRAAVEKCDNSRESVRVEAGEYEVILEEDAVATLVGFLARMGFSAMGYQEGRSFMAGRLGQKVVGENITIWDDGTDPAGASIPFDGEGVPKRKLMLIENGVAKNICYDSYTAGRDRNPGTKSTGHAGGGWGWGPMPANLFMKAGDATIQDMIANTKRGIWVTRFHYVNPVHPVKTIITGMTRDGTFLIENGQVVAAVKNFRFTQSVLEALSNVQMISHKTKLIAGRRGGMRVPALKIAKFNFTGVTEF